ncbi:MAG: zinc ribbon domain-containing protein [Solirubrobacteraceae bacterium]|nr:zinc ribbon domain-containing protein [Solirubrobacteraceae bacterium]
MPIYEYRRPDGTTFEVLQKFSDDALTVDPDTGVPVQRVLSAPAIHFKGSGFHNTDYGTKRRNREKAAAESAGGESGSGGGASADSSSSSDSSAGNAASKGDSGASSSGASSKGSSDSST